MCGIVGVFGNVQIGDEKAFKQLLVANQLRGAHSTGVLSVKRHTDELVVAKALGTPDNLMDTKQFDKAMGLTHRFLLGHNRFATQGKITASNAHPFTFGSITGVHNGSLTSYRDLDGYDELPVDSQCIYQHMANNGLRDTVDNFTGAAALVWWDASTNEVNVWKNSLRELAWATTKTGAIYIASELAMLEWILYRNKIVIDQASEFENEKHIRWQINKGQTHGLKPTITNVEKKTYFTPITRLPTPSTSPFRGESANASNDKKRTEPVLFDRPVDQAVVKAKSIYCEVKAKGMLQKVEGWWLESPEYAGKQFFVCNTSNVQNLQIGDWLLGDVSGYARDLSGIPAYYICSPTAEIFPASEAVKTTASIVLAKNLVEIEEEEDETTKEYRDARGRYITAAAWKTLYGNCGYCNGDCDPETARALPGVDHFLCDECGTNPTIVDSVGGHIQL